MTSRFLCIQAFFASAVFSFAHLNGPEQKVKALGGRLFHKKGEVVEVVLIEVLVEVVLMVVVLMEVLHLEEVVVEVALAEAVLVEEKKIVKV